MIQSLLRLAGAYYGVKPYCPLSAVNFHYQLAPPPQFGVNPGQFLQSLISVFEGCGGEAGGLLVGRRIQEKFLNVARSQDSRGQPLVEKSPSGPKRRRKIRRKPEL